jgi:hypothetical protein
VHRLLLDALTICGGACIGILALLSIPDASEGDRRAAGPLGRQAFAQMPANSAASHVDQRYNRKLWIVGLLGGAAYLPR